ncbi:M48 family metalloprotease [Polymorphobacter multimanifer]|uniref:Putative Zn-dependent protease n=1 Tax=Polymorphobacter multimanifer TaxID=1070431 RepID=A0A841LAX7_9SPHN|nr:M48 family metalloprotease [Polymorphobacter multimanifer]MBB6226168.1 putative Zn-dependent protease [Polymorphobacter multimanifer]
MRKISLALIPLALLASASAAQGPGFSTSERKIGIEAHPQLLQQFGGAMQGRAADYVKSVGQRIAGQSGMSARPQDYTVTLLNSNINNAFALPGGYVYISRQLLALLSNEAELAFVMGHEVGHVAARHSQSRQQRSTISGIGAAILGAVTGSNIVGQLANTGAQLYTLGFSREQERQADSLGLRYLAQAGYDPMSSASSLNSLGAQTGLEARLTGKGSGSGPSWLSTHPANNERVARIRKEAQTFTARAGARAMNRDTFLDAIDGLPYDDDATQGVIEGTRFRHPQLGLAFEAPSGFVLENTPTAVNGARGNAGRFQSTGGQPEGQTLAAYSARIWAAAGAQSAPQVQIRRINGIETAVSSVRQRSNSGEVDATLAVYRWNDNAWYQMLMIAPAGRDPGFQTLLNSVRRLTPQETAGIRGRRVSVVRVGANDTVASLAARMDYTDDKVARFTILNGIAANTRLVPGSRVKLIVRG